MRMATTNLDSAPKWVPNFVDTPSDFKSSLDNFDIQKASSIVWNMISDIDKRIQVEEPFKLVKVDPEKGKRIIEELRDSLLLISVCLSVLIPETAEKIKELILNHKMPEIPLFLRKD